MPKHSKEGCSGVAASRIDFQAEGCKGVILASLPQFMRKPTSREVSGERTLVAVGVAEDAVRDAALDVPMVATLNPSPEPKGRRAAVVGAAVVLALA